jgi:transcriptional regulator with GAF, ATPase, and Fis domain
MDKDKKTNPSYRSDNDQINILLGKLVSEVKGFMEKQLDQIRRLNQIGTALSAEKNLDRLLEMIVDEAREFTNADGGTLYIMTDDEEELHCAEHFFKCPYGGNGRKDYLAVRKIEESRWESQSCQCFCICRH